MAKEKEKLFTIYKDDFTVQTFRAGGKGGQKQNKTDSGVRIIHNPSGAAAESRTERSQYMNKKLALHKLVKTARFRMWLAEQVKEIDTGKSLEQRVEESMSPNNIKVEGRNTEGSWEEIE